MKLEEFAAGGGATPEAAEAWISQETNHIENIAVFALESNDEAQLEHVNGGGMGGLKNAVGCRRARGTK